jgi:hypothetical protein
VRIKEILSNPDYTLQIIADDWRIGVFDVAPYLKYEAFADLRNQDAFMQIANRGYFIEWDCGADLSADTIEARWQVKHGDNISA